MNKKEEKAVSSVKVRWDSKRVKGQVAKEVAGVNEHLRKVAMSETGLVEAELVEAERVVRAAREAVRGMILTSKHACSLRSVFCTCSHGRGWSGRHTTSTRHLGVVKAALTMA
mmetsp:Transcript_26795/g.63684  ORF Transcript_26795/g.63684 Transcript_26795/m.63684 type:complete len:113 (-) Transcript_26795:425-763(-)